MCAHACVRVSMCLCVCLCICPRESLWDLPGRAPSPWLYLGPSCPSLGSAPVTAPGGVCFLSGPGLWSEGDGGAPRWALQAHLISWRSVNQVGPLGVLPGGYATLDLGFWNAPSLALQLISRGNRLQLGKDLPETLTCKWQSLRCFPTFCTCSRPHRAPARHGQLQR